MKRKSEEIIEEEREVKKKLIDLPNEIIVKIFKYLEIKDKVKFGETCKWMNENYIENMIGNRNYN